MSLDDIVAVLLFLVGVAGIVYCVLKDHGAGGQP
jgi:hypothetical protein